MGEMLSKGVAGSSDRVWNCYHSRVMRTNHDNRSKLRLDLDRLSCTMSLTGNFRPRFNGVAKDHYVKEIFSSCELKQLAI